MKAQNPAAGRPRFGAAWRDGHTAEPLQRLVPLSWRGELLLICCGMLLSFLIAGFWYPYWRIADMDFPTVYNAFLLNVPLPQDFFDHPGYLSILLLSWWLRALHAFGLVHVISLSALPPASDGAAFTEALTAATRAGRVLSLISAIGFVISFAYLLRALVRDWRIAAFGAFLLAFSGGMAMEMRILRTELLATALFFSALLLLLVVARTGQRWWRPAVIGFASLLITLAMQNKIQVFFLILALPVLTLPFGAETTSQRGFWNNRHYALPALGAFVIVALGAIYAAKDLLVTGFTVHATATLDLPRLHPGATIYWPALAIWLGIGMTTYALVWKVARLEALAAALAAVTGCMVGLLALYLRYHPNDVLVVFHPIEGMLRWAAASEPQLAGHGSFLNAARLKFAFDAVAGVIARRTFVLSSSPRPTIFLEWFVIAATVIAIRRREWRLVLQICALMTVDWGVDTLSMARGLKQEYFLLTDPLAIIAAALLIARLSDLQRHRWAYPVGAALIVAHIAVSQAEPIKHIFRTDGPEVVCGLYGGVEKLHQLLGCKP